MLHTYLHTPNVHYLNAQDMDREVFDEVNMTDVHLKYFCHAAVAAATARTDRWARKGKQGAAPNVAPAWMYSLMATDLMPACFLCGNDAIPTGSTECPVCMTPIGDHVGRSYDHRRAREMRRGVHAAAVPAPQDNM